MSTAETEFVLSPVAVAVNAWRSALIAIGRIPLLVAVLFGLMLLAWFLRMAIFAGVEYIVPRDIDPRASLQITMIFDGLAGLPVGIIPSAVAGLSVTHFVLFGNTNWKIAFQWHILFRYAAWLLAFDAFRFLTEVPGFFLWEQPAVFGRVYSWAIYAFWIFIIVRLLMVLPATVADSRRASLAASWRQTRGSFWRIFFCGALAVAPFYIADKGLNALWEYDLRQHVNSGQYGLYTPIFIATQVVKWTLGFFHLYVWLSLQAWIYRSLPEDGMRAG